MTVSERIWSCWGPSRLAHHGDLRSSQWSKRQKLHRPPLEWKNKSLLWHPFRCVEWKASSVTAAEFCGAVIPSDLHVPVNSAVFIHKTLALNSLSSTLSCEWIRVFLWAIIRLKFTEHFTLRFRIRDLKKLQEKVLNSTCRTILVCKLSQNVNFDGFWTLTVWHFWQL